MPRRQIPPPDLHPNWLEAEAMLRQGQPMSAVARHMGVGTATVAGWLDNIREAREAQENDHSAMRTCLWCERSFLSSGPGNRRCPRCAGRSGGIIEQYF
ncbi:hypothetical protein QO231_24930 [Sedimentitalea todarodis]|uniref:Helix-turn-helix domain-containing protein n=2 Tax=Sedimentitalea todarodis TaxID=1631240 RepID=A0ABU3VLK4_9RHOB|nr:hypothetical protein [Sedimentitalea todarodis]